MAPQIQAAWSESLAGKGASPKSGESKPASETSETSPATETPASEERRRHGVHHTQEQDHMIGYRSERYGLAETMHQDRVDIHPSWKDTSLGGNITHYSGTEPQVHLNSLAPEQLSGLSASQRRTFLDGLPDGDRQTRYTTQDADGNQTERRRDEDPATTLARRMYASSDSTAFAETFAARPESVLPWMDARSSGVLTDNMDLILRDMRATGGVIDEREQRALGALHEGYLRTHGGSDPQQVQESMQDLMRTYSERGLMDPASSHLSQAQFTEQYGVLAGSMAAGLGSHMENVGFDQQRASSVKWDLLEAGAGFLPGLAGSTAQALLKCAQIDETLGDRPFRAEDLPARFLGSMQTQERQWERSGYPAGWSQEQWGAAQDVISETLNNNGFMVGR